MDIALLSSARVSRDAGGNARRWRTAVVLACCTALGVSLTSPIGVRTSGVLGAQESARSDAQLDSLVARALAVSPRLRAATARVAAARARVGPAAALPDPVLMAGIVNQPLGTAPLNAMGNGGPEPMTMRMIGIGQSIPFPGKRSLKRQTAEQEGGAAQAAVDDVRRQLRFELESTYFELAFADRALEIVRRNSELLGTLISVTEARYASGSAGQQDMLKARVEATRLAETAAELSERRTVLLAQLNALIDRPSDTPLPPVAIPDDIARRAVARSNEEIRFTSAALGSRASGSPLKPLAELQEAAIRGNTELREHEAMTAVQRLRVALAKREHLPDIDLSIQYGQRGSGLPDMVTATVAVPLPVFKARKQDQVSAETEAQLAALEAEHHEKVNALRADVVRLVSEIERARTRLALTVKATLPQSRAALASATASYQSGKAEFLSVLDAQASLFTLETDYYRALTDFAKNVAELRRVVGEEVLQ